MRLISLISLRSTESTGNSVQNSMNYGVSAKNVSPSFALRMMRHSFDCTWHQIEMFTLSLRGPIGPIMLMLILSSLLQLTLCSPVDYSCWDCLAERSSISLASSPVIKGLTFCNPKNASAALALLSIHNFDASVEYHYSSCGVFCGELLHPLLWGELFEVSARAIMKCALRSLSVPAVAYSLRSYSLRCMLAALRLRKPLIATPPASGALFSDAFVYMGPPHNLDLRGKRGLGNWAEFKLSLQVVVFQC